MKCIAIDPSSSKTGYAVLGESGNILEAGLLLPRKVRDVAIVRIDCMCDDLRTLLGEHSADHIVVEVPSGHQHGRIERKTRGLATYGMAVGAMYATCRAFPSGRTHVVNANDWTAGVSKDFRLRLLAMNHPKEYDPEADKGGDIGDAICLGQWWLDRFRFARRSSAMRGL